MPDASETFADAASKPNFCTTCWTEVLTAKNLDSPQSKGALGSLCQKYWYPLYAYVRHRGYSPHDAQDLTQEFFEQLLERNFLSAVRRERGKFRWFMLCAMKRFLINGWKLEHAKKRGGNCVMISLDQEHAEGRYSSEIAHHASPDKIFDQTWAITLLHQAQMRLRAEYTNAGKCELFEQLKVFLSGDKVSHSCAQVGTTLGMSEGATKVAIHRLRLRYRDCLRAEIGNTVSTPAEVDEEIRQLFSVFSD